MDEEDPVKKVLELTTTAPMDGPSREESIDAWYYPIEGGVRN